jgi:hypothetical protein
MSPVKTGSGKSLPMMAKDEEVTLSSYVSLLLNFFGDFL